MTPVEMAVGETTAETTTPAPEAGFSSQQTAPDSGERDFEAEARDLGWRPKDEFSGKPEHWKDAKTYVEFDVVGNRISKIERAVEERVAKIEKVNAKTIKQLEAAHAKEIAELRETRKEAILAGDVNEVDRLDQQIEVMRSDGPDTGDKPREKMTDAERQQDDEKTQQAWIDKQEWWGVDEDLTAIAIGISNRITKPGMSMEENIRLTEAALAKKFPDKFWGKTTAANGHAAVDGGGMSPGALKTDPLARLPSEARQQAKSDMAKYPKLYPTGDAWIKVYNS